MTANPQYFFRFSASHYPLLLDLFYRAEGTNDVELYALIERHRNQEDPSVYHVADQLLKLGILETIPDATATYEMTRQVKNLLAYLLREHRLTSVTVIQAYLKDLDQLGEELREAIKLSRGNQAARAMAEISDLIERIRQDSGANREAVINEVMTVKSNPEQISVRERFERINRLWTRYLVPLRDLIDVRKAMDQSLDSMEAMTREGMRVFTLDGAVSRELGRIRARLLRLRRDVATDFRESMREIEPLYQTLRRESQLVRGASRALELIHRNGEASLSLTERMALPAWRLAGLFSDPALVSLFYNIKGYSPGRIPVIPHGPEEEEKAFIDPEAMLKALRLQMPIKDVLEWLNLNFEEAPLAELLRAYGRIFNSNICSLTFGPSQKTYHIGGSRITAHPMQVEHAP